MRTHITVAVSLMLALPTIGAISTEAVEPADDISALAARLEPKFRAFTLDTWNRDALLADARDDGRVTLTLLGKSYPLLLREVVVNGPGAFPTLLQPDGSTILDPTYDFESAFFRGSVDGAPESEALLTITRIGADGFVRTETEWIQFEPLAGLINEAPGEIQIIYRTVDMKFMTGNPDPEDDLPVLPAPNEGENFGVLTHTLSMKINGDNEFYTTYSSCWYCKMDNVMGRVSNIYSGDFSWTLVVNYKSTCSSQQCNIDTGRSSTSATTLRQAYANYEATYRNTWGETWVINHLFTGKNLDSTTIGIAYKAGRYGLSMMINDDDYDGQSTDYEAAILVAHETGHNFNGNHDYATSSTHWHGLAAFTHYTIMRTPWSHEPSEWKEMIEDFSSTNRNVMNSCKTGSWSSFSFSPGSYTC